MNQRKKRSLDKKGTTMLNNLSRAKHIFIRVIVSLTAIAAMFGFRCPAEGCPACKMLGK